MRDERLHQKEAELIGGPKDGMKCRVAAPGSFSKELVFPVFAPVEVGTRPAVYVKPLHTLVYVLDVRKGGGRCYYAYRFVGRR
jgi:hypothetical protein